jgi:glycerol uptake facilitator-like aquaporin
VYPLLHNDNGVPWSYCLTYGLGLKELADITANLVGTYPQADLTKASQFFSEFIASAILMFVIFALRDDTKQGTFTASGNWFPLALFFLIFGLGACFGSDTGYVSCLLSNGFQGVTCRLG